MEKCKGAKEWKNGWMNRQVMNLYYEDVHSYIFNLASKTFLSLKKKKKKWPCHMACRVLVPWPEIKPAHPALEAQSHNL